MILRHIGSKEALYEDLQKVPNLGSVSKGETQMIIAFMIIAAVVILLIRRLFKTKHIEFKSRYYIIPIICAYAAFIYHMVIFNQPIQFSGDTLGTISEESRIWEARMSYFVTTGPLMIVLFASLGMFLAFVLALITHIRMKGRRGLSNIK